MIERNADTVIADVKKMISDREHRELTPNELIESGFFLNMFLLDEKDKLIDLESSLAILVQTSLEAGDTNAKAQAKAKATELWKEMKKQEAKVKMIEQYILLVKKWATITVSLGG